MDYMIKEETLTDIADAIRGQTGDVNPIAVSDFASEISSIVGGGSHVELTQAEYDALTEEEKNNGSVYFITDTNGNGEDFQPVIYSLDEREIGVWADGKPLYEVTLTNTAAASATNSAWSSVSWANEPSNIDVLVSAELNGTNNNSVPNLWNTLRFGMDGGHVKIASLQNGALNANSHVTIRYTKITDTAGSGTWTPQGVPAVHFSTDEHIIGTWIDGSPVYEKVVDLGALPNNTTKNVAHGISNLGRVLQAELCADNGTNWITIPYATTSSQDLMYQVGFWLTDTNIAILSIWDRSAFSGYAILKYTKST